MASFNEYTIEREEPVEVNGAVVTLRKDFEPYNGEWRDVRRDVSVDHEMTIEEASASFDELWDMALQQAPSDPIDEIEQTVCELYELMAGGE